MHELPDHGTNDELCARLGSHLIDKYFENTPKRKVTMKMKGWYAFLKSERENVIASGIEGRANVLKEIARRWKIVKTAGTSTAPLLLTLSLIHI